MTVPSAVMELFVTHIESESRLLKVWAQRDRNQVIFVERLILQIKELLDKGVGIVQPTSLAVGQLCCAKYNDGSYSDDVLYYRARVISLDRIADGLIGVQFVDYGNKELIPLSDVRSLQTLPQSPLTNLRDQASEFYLAGVIANTPTWDDTCLEIIKQRLRYEEVQGVLMAEVGNKKLLRIYCNETDFSEFLSSQRIGTPIQLPSQQQFLLHAAQLQMPSHYSQMCNFNIPPPRVLVHEKPAAMIHSNVKPAVLDPRVQQMHMTTHGEKVFTTPVLEINSEHQVYVSFVEDGPWSFAVQLQAMEETLSQLMAEINENAPTPLSHPLIPGSVCLGRFSEDQTLCRAVVMSVMTDKCMLYYVDFGNSETRPYSEIYELPPKYINPKVMALRFALSGLRDVPESDEIKALFKERVTEKLLLLKVMPPDGPPVKQYCELTDNGQNVLKVLLEQTRPLEYKSLLLSIGAIDTAVVSYIVNPSHFYIQLSRHVSALSAVMLAVETHCTNTAPPLSQQSLKVGLPCCALYAEDEKWYRAQIISILPGSVNVKYVDYGNSDTVPLSSLRKIERNLVSVLHTQAVKCSLNGFEDMKSDLLATKFEELTGEETLKLSVLGKVEDCFIVDLYNTSSGSEIDIGNVLLQTKAAMEQPAVQLQPVQHENRYERSAPVIAADGDEWQEAAHFMETSEDTTSAFNRNYQSRAAEKERFNRGSRFLRNNEISHYTKGVSWRNPVGKPRHNDEDKDSWRSQKDDRSWRNKDDTNGNWRDDQDKGRRGKERFGEGRWGSRDETEREQKPWRENNGEQREYKKKTWGRDEDQGGYGGGGNRRNREDADISYNRRNEDRRRNTEDEDGLQNRRFDDRRRNNDDQGEGFRGRRGEDRRRNNDDGEGFSDRRKRFNSDDSRRGRDSDRKWKNADGDFDNSRGGRKPWNNKEDNHSQFDRKSGHFGDSAPVEQGEEDWSGVTTITTSTATKTCATIKSPNISVGDTKTVEIVFSTNPQDFYVQVSESTELLTLMDEIASAYESEVAINMELLKNGSACIARYVEDETWYRAVVESVDGDSVLVFFCDYGNKENVPLTDIKEIKSEHIQLPAQGIPCSLLAAKSQDLSWSSSEIDSFTGATDGKTLEAKFVSQNNGKFEIILKDTESSSDINLQFGATPEQLEAKPAARKPAHDIFSAPIQTQQLIDLSQRYSTQLFSPETVEQVSVTWFIDPEQFYCQLKSSHAAINDMMTSIQEAYCTKSPTSRPFQVGLPVIAKFRADNVLYRAEVKEIEDPVSVVVQFIDYGNCDNVMNSCIWDMEARFMELPKQAILSSLQGVKPADEKWSQRETMKYFEAEEFQCTFHRLMEEKFEVTLFCNEMDIAISMIEAGLAKKEILQIAGKTESDEEPVDLNLLPGQMLNVHVTFVESAAKFFVHLNAKFAQKIQAMVDQHAENPENLQPVDAERFSVGELCLASPDSVQWYRAKIMDCTQTTGVFVTFIDFGDGDEVPVNEVMVSPSTLQSQPAQATECALYGLNVALTPEVEDKFKTDIEDKDVIMKIEAVETGRLLVILYDMEGKKFEIQKDTEAEPVIERLCPLPVISRKIRVWVSHVNNENSLWLQRAVDSDALSELLDKIHNIYEEEGKGDGLSAVAGNLCAAKSENFGTWYRARILCVNSEEEVCDVLFIDYGNTESVPIKTNIKSLDTSLFHPHELAVHVSLPLTSVLNTQLQEMIADKEFMAIFSKKNGEKWFADLFEGNMSLSQKLIEMGQATLLPGLELENQTTETVAEIAAPLEVFVSHFDSPSQFWLQLSSNAYALEKFQENIQIIAESLPTTDATQVGVRCISQFSEDNLWYRAEVLDINSSYITVRYTDYGNTSQVEVTAEGMKELPEELHNTPDFAFPCCINASPIDGSYWNAEAVARCEELLNQEAAITINVVGKEETKIVNIFVNGISVVDVLLQEDLALPRKSSVTESCTTNALPETEDISSNAKLEKMVELQNIGEEHEEKLAVVTHVESLEEFWLQYRSSADNVHQLEYRLLEATSFPVLNDIEEGKLCAAIFDDDSNWYRAKILGKVDHGIQVQFIDYGNISVCEELRKLPLDLADMPPMAQHCALALPETVTEWPSGAKEKFLDIANTSPLFQVNIVEVGDPVIVSLTYNGRQIETEICKDEIMDPSKFIDKAVHGMTVTDVLHQQNLAVPEAENISSDAKNADHEHSDKMIEPTNSANAKTNVSNCVEEYEEKMIEPTNSANAKTNVSNCVEEYDEGLEIAGELGEEHENQIENLAVVSHAESLEEFWLQYQSLADNIQQLEYRLLEAESFPVLSAIQEGKLCAAIFDNDSSWYRAKILGKTDHGIQVRLIDYGNISVCEDLRKLPSDLAIMPPMAQRCALSLPGTATEWPSGAKEKFLNLVKDGSIMFEVKVIAEGNPVVVSLTYDDRQIETEICQDELESTVYTMDPSKTKQPADQEDSTVYYMIEKEEYQDNIMKVPESLEDKAEVLEGNETDGQEVKKGCGQEVESQNEVHCNDGSVPDLKDKDTVEVPETETSDLSGELPVADKNHLDKNGTEIEKHAILAMSDDIQANDGKEQVETSKLPAVSVHYGLLTDEKLESTEGSPEKKSDTQQQINALSALENPHKEPSADKAENENGVCSTVKSSENKIEHTEKLVMKLNVEMMVMEKEEKKSQIDKITPLSASKELTSNKPQIENGAAKSEPSTPLLSRVGRLSVKDGIEKQERSSSSPRLCHNERIVPGCISRGDSLDSVDETMTVNVHDIGNIVPDTSESADHS